MLPEPPRTSPAIRRHGRPVYLVPNINGVMMAIWVHQVAEQCGHEVSYAQAVNGIMVLTTGDIMDVQMAIIVLEPLLLKLQRAMASDLMGLLICNGRMPAGGEMVDPNIPVEWID